MPTSGRLKGMIDPSRKFLLSSLPFVAAVLGLGLTGVHAQEDIKTCKSTRFRSPFDQTVDVTAYVKAGDRCTIKLLMDNVGKAVVVRNARLGKTAQIPDTADMTFTPNNTVSGLDQFIYDIERTDNDKPVKQRIRVEISVLKAKDYPSQVAFKDEPLPASSQSQSSSETSAPAPAKPQAK